MSEKPAAGAGGSTDVAPGKPLQVSQEHPAVVFGYIAGEERAVQVASQQDLVTALRLIAASSVEAALDVGFEPTSTMERWQYFRVRWADGRRTRHLVGWARYEGRACSAIAAIDLVKRHVVTQSGRVYELVGPSGHDKEAAWVWSRWLSVNPVEDPSDQTRALNRAFDKAASRAKPGQASHIIRSSFS